MGDDSERLHLEGLDQATERERCEEHFAAPTDLPDAETAWAEFRDKTHGFSAYEIESYHETFLAGFAAASGAWAEQLDAAACGRMESDGWCTAEHESLNMRAERDAARAELDNLRDVPAECDNGQANTCRHDSASGMDASFGPGKVWRCDHCGLCWIEGYSPHDPRAAIVRGSDDEA